MVAPQGPHRAPVLLFSALSSFVLNSPSPDHSLSLLPPQYLLASLPSLLFHGLVQAHHWAPVVLSLSMRFTEPLLYSRPAENPINETDKILKELV